MRFVAPLLAVALATVTSLYCAPTTEVSRTPPPVYTSHLAGLLTPVADVMDGRTAFPGDDSGGIALLFEKVVYQGDDGISFRVSHIVQHAVDEAGAKRIATDIYTYDRDREDIFLIDAATIRADGVRMPLEAGGAFIQTPQHEAENSLYTSEAELSLIFPRVVPGTTTESTVLIRENQPVMPGEFALAHTFSRGWPAHRQRLVLDLPTGQLARIKSVITGSGVPEPSSENYAPGRERRTWIRAGAPYIAWEERGPSFEYRGPTLWLTTLDSWDSVSTWFDGLIADRSDLGRELEDEVDRWTEGLSEKTAILDRLTEKVANDVRYVGLEFGLAGYQPHPCALVWKTRYGDCKDKANLLRAMLAHKGIPAHVVLLQTGGLGRVQKDSPSWRQFNHAIVAVEDGRGGYTFCDPTIKYLPAGSIGLSDIGRDVLVNKGKTAEWVRTPDPLDSAIRIRGDLELASNGSLNGWFTLGAEGYDAAGYADYLNGMDRDARLRWLQRLAADFFPGANVVDTDYVPVTGSVRTIAVRAYLTRDPRASGDQALVFPYPSGWMPSADTPGERKFPYVTQRRVESVDVSIKIPEGWGSRAVPAAFTAPSPVAEFSAAWNKSPGLIEARLAWHPKQNTISAADYPVFQRSVRALTAWLEQPVVLEPTASGPAGTAAAVPAASVELGDFPILPTGQGQLRLLNERYPESGKPALRRAALQRILQWFPNDTETVFEAQVWLASLDWDAGLAKEFADRTTVLLQTHGQQVSPSLRAWAIFLEARARWQAEKDPAAIARLQQLADDTTCGAYRRGWSALSAGRYLREGDPKAALEFLLRHDDYESDARAGIVELIAMLYSQIQDTKAMAVWTASLVNSGSEDADDLLAGAIDAVEGDEKNTALELRREAMAAFAGVVSDAGAHPKTAEALRAWAAKEKGLAALDAFQKGLSSWLAEHRPAWWSPEKSDAWADTGALMKQIDAWNDAKEGRKLADGVMQLLLHHDAPIDKIAQYLRWTLWWMDKQEFSAEMIDVIGQGVLGLRTDESPEVIRCWFEYARILGLGTRLQEAGAIYKRAFDDLSVKDYQKVDAGGEWGLLELKAGNVDEALAAFHSILPVHTSHKWSVDFLYPAVLLHVARGEYDAALALIAEMGRQEDEYIDGSDHKLAVRGLLRAAARPEGLVAYWKRTSRWIATWDGVLQVNAIPTPKPAQLPLTTDFNALAGRIDKAVASKNISACLGELDTYARIARVVPAFVPDLCTQSEKTGALAPALRQRIYLALVDLMLDPEPVDPEFDGSIRVWECIVLGELDRKPEAVARAKTLVADFGLDHPRGVSGLRLWLAYARGTTDDVDAIAKAELLLKEGKDVSMRLHTVRVLSDTYMLAKNDSAQRSLLLRETVRADFDGKVEDGAVLKTRLNDLEAADRKGGALTAALNSWLEKQDISWLDHVAPTEVDDPRFASLREPSNDRPASLPFAERLKFDLLTARDDRQSPDTRAIHFNALVFALAARSDDVMRYGEILASASEIRALSDARRAWFVTAGLRYLVSRGETAAAMRLAEAKAFRLMAEPMQASYRACHLALVAAEEGKELWEEKVVSGLMGAPLDLLRLAAIDHIVARLSHAGQFDRAGAVVGRLKEASLASTVEDPLAALRLGWTRSIRQVRDQAAFVQRVREIVSAIPETTATPLASVRRHIGFDRLAGLNESEHLAVAMLALARGDLMGASAPVIPLRALNDAPDLRNRDPMLYTRLLEAALTVAAPDKARESWVSEAVSGCDTDRPEVRARVNELFDDFLRAPAAVGQEETRRTILLVRGFIAMRSSTEPRPAALFSALDQTGIPETLRRSLQLRFFVTRGLRDEGLHAAEVLDPAELTRTTVYMVARNGLLAAGHVDEVALLDETMREHLARSMADYWYDPLDPSVFSWLQVARVLNAGDLVPAAWFESAIAATSGDFRKSMLRVHQAHLEGNWAVLRTACDGVLGAVPDFYNVYYDRAVARMHLEDRAGALADLRIMLGHARDHVEYQSAVALFRELAPGEEPP